tara:strand:+ start:1059 stop:2996 length:1938 start_codon:yes stop_codon:yes gene_type:complete
MAIAPVNKFISVAVPVAPGENKLYEVPTGTSALLLYAQVSNVGIGTYPTVTFIQRRQTRSTGLTRDIRVIKDVEVPPNDALILIDGRLVLEKTALVVDSLYIRGTQTGITTINNVTYDEPTGVATVSCAGTHGFTVGNQITLAGIAFTCPDNTAGITTTIFPDPQKSYIVDSIVDVVGTSRTFTSIVGGAKGYKHVYNTAIHNFVRAKPDAVSFTNLSNANKYNVTNAAYRGSTGIVTFTIPDHQMITDDGSTYTSTGADYDGRVGILTVTLSGHPYVNGNLVKFDDRSLGFKCTLDNKATIHYYPRRGRDQMSGRWKAVTKISASKFEVDVGTTKFDYYTVSDALYDPVAGIATVTIGTHNLVAGITSVRLAPQSLGFTCTAGSGTKLYPRANGQGGASSDDPAYDDSVGVTSTTETTISLDVGTSSNTTAHTFVPATKLTPTSGTYNPSTGVMQLTIANHKIENGDAIKIDDGSITFSCDYGGYVGVASYKSYPRTAKDPASDTWLEVTYVDANNFTVNVGASPDLSPHTFVSATAESVTRSVVKTGGAYSHEWASTVSGSMLRSTNTIGIATESIIFTCTMDNNQTEHAYPRTSDPAHNTAVAITEADYNTISANVGISSAGGQVSPLQMEFLASILENSNA